MIHEKSQSFDVFKSYKVEVENQLGKKIKDDKSYRGGEYYGRYNGLGEQSLWPFVAYLQECGIIHQYTMSRTPSQNGVEQDLERYGKKYDKSFF